MGWGRLLLFLERAGVQCQPSGKDKKGVVWRG